MMFEVNVLASTEGIADGDWWSSLLFHKVHSRGVVSENEVRIQLSTI